MLLIYVVGFNSVTGMMHFMSIDRWDLRPPVIMDIHKLTIKTSHGIDSGFLIVNNLFSLVQNWQRSDPINPPLDQGSGNSSLVYRGPTVLKSSLVILPSQFFHWRNQFLQFTVLPFIWSIREVWFFTELSSSWTCMKLKKIYNIFPL